jgi:hypothetical protein
MTTIYADYAIDLAVDVSAIFLMAYGLYSAGTAARICCWRTSH